MADIEDKAARYIEVLIRLSELIGFDKAYGLIVASLTGDEEYTWDDKDKIFRSLREGWMERYDSTCQKINKTSRKNG